MTTPTEAQLALLDAPNPAWASVLRPDGSIHSTVVWVEVADGVVSFNTSVGRAKERHLRKDAHLTISVIDPENSQRFVSLSGTATLVEEGADAQIDRLAGKYLGADAYPWRQPGEQRITVVLDVEDVIGQG